MKNRARGETEAAQRLRRVEAILDEALDDLAGRGASAPCSHCGDLLAKAFSELQVFSKLVNETLPDRADLARELKMVLSRLSAAQRLLTAASEFHRGWCAAGMTPSQPVAGYQADCLMHGPALLAMEG